MPLRILHLLPTLDHGADAARAALLGEHLGADFEQHVAALRLTGGAAERFQRSGAVLHDLRRRHAWDPFAWLRLRGLIRELRPDVVQTWGDSAADYATASGAGGRLVRSLNAPRGVVETVESATLDRATLGLPIGCRLIGVVTRLDPSKGVQDLLWAMDLVRVLADDVRLVIVGDGPERPALERFSALACEADRIHFLGECDDTAALLPHFEMLWATDQSAPPMALLEAMAAGLPVVCDAATSDTPAVVHGETGLCITPGDRAERGKATLRLLGDNALREQLGQAARRRACDVFPLSAMLDAYAASWQAIAGRRYRSAND